MMPLIDLSGASVLTTFEFNVAYAKYVSTSADRLQVLASVDCGNTWTIAYDKEGTALSTAPQSSTAFVPTSTQWRHESIDLTPYTGSPEVMFMFVTTSDYGNNVYVDDITIADGAVGINEISSSSMLIYPNPATDQLTISFQASQSDLAVVRLMDSAGRIVCEKSVSPSPGKTLVSMDVSVLAKGFYVASLSSNSISCKQPVVLR